MRGLLILLLVSTVAFAGEATGVASRILDGTNVPASKWPTVGEVGDADGGFYCTGTLIAPNAVLCAGHCVADDNGGKVNIGAGRGRFRLGGITYPVINIIVHPTYKGFNDETEGQIDCSILILDSAVIGVTPTPLNRIAPIAGQNLTIVGYGIQGSGAAQNNDGTPAAGTVNEGNAPLETVTQTFLKWVFQKGESDTASGDSGGPAFLLQNGAYVLAGITSGGSGEGYGNSSFDARVDTIASWVDSQIGSVTPPPPPAPGDGISIVSAPSATPNPAQPNATVTFSAAANDTTATWSWDFGDGSALDRSGPSVQHDFASVGNYTVTVTASANGQSASATLTLFVQTSGSGGGGIGGGGGGSTVLDVTVNAKKKNFKTNFVNSTKSRFNLVVIGGGLNNLDLNGTTLTMLVDGEEFDSVDFGGPKKGLGSYGDSTVKYNAKRGELTYALKGDAVLEMLDMVGLDHDQSGSLDVPVTFMIAGTNFGGTYRFAVKVKPGKTAMGK